MQLKDTKMNNVPIFALSSTKDISATASKILGASFESKTKVWYFPSYYPFGLQVWKELNMLFPRMIVDDSVYIRLKYLEKSDKIIKGKNPLKSFTYKTEPMDHQLEGLLYGITFIRLGIFWECGVGKTKTAIDIMRFLKINTLYLCPTRLVETIVDEIVTHSFPTDFEVHHVIGSQSKEKKLQKLYTAINSKTTAPKIYIIGYETVSRGLVKEEKGKGEVEKGESNEVDYFQLVSQLNYDLIILDESHKLRTHNSNTSAIVSKLAAKAYRRILMTGTPSLGNPLHLFVQMRILMPWKYSNFFAFKAKFVEVSPYNKMIVVGFKNLHIIREQVDQFSIRKTKEECLDLPERMVIHKKMSMSDEQRRIYEEVISGLHPSVSYNPMMLLKIGKLHQICGGTLVESPIDQIICDMCISMSKCIEEHITPFTKNCIRKDVERPTKTIIIKDNPKLDLLKEMLNNLMMGEGKKVILWYKYINEKKIILEMMKKNKLEYVDYDQGHSTVVKFQNCEEPLAFISQIQQSSGITLTAATYTIYYSQSYDQEFYLQSRDRMYRKGQTKKTTEFHLLMHGSIDELILNRLTKKETINDALLRQDLQKKIISKISLL